MALLIFAVWSSAPAWGAGTTYYVANAGSDSYNGLTPGTAFKTIGKVNSLTLQPGDKVLFKCGDTWRATMLVIKWSGATGNPITFGSYPEGCANKPILSGAQPISGWTSYATNIYRANLSTGFGSGINQLFRNGQRLTMGRWPNLNAGNGGYSTIDGQSGTQLTDNQLPPGDWSGAVAHIRAMRWYILNRQVSSSSGQTLTLGASAGCWDGCPGWGFFLNNHLRTLDQEGEWFYDAATKQVYLYTTTAPAAGEVEGSVILKTGDDAGRGWGGVNLGKDLDQSAPQEIAYVIVENFDIRRWFKDGIASPTNLAHYDNHDLTVRNNTITDVDGSGIQLATWVYQAQDGRPDGWRGGYNLTFTGNTIDGPNHMGIDIYSRQSSFTYNTIRNVGLVKNLGAAGLGCGFSDGEGACTEDGDGFRVKVDQANDSGNSNTISNNRLELIAYGGIQIFGHHNTLERNVIDRACYTKGDCGAISTYGSAAHDLTFRQNIIVDTIGNTDGCNSDYKELFGFGVYLSGSTNVTVAGNTVISSTVNGILFQDTTGAITNNTLYNNGWTWPYAPAQVRIDSSPSYASSHQGNILFGLDPDARTLSANDSGRLGTSDYNYFFHPYQANHIQANGDRTLASWRSYSGKDAHSKEAWYSQAAGETPRSRIFYNDTTSSKTFELGDRLYLDLDQNQVVGSLTLEPFTSKILIDNGPAYLTLTSIMPTFWGADEAQDFTLIVKGAKFTGSSVVRWNGSARSTTFVSGSELRAAILAADVSSVGYFPVTVYDPTQTTGPTETDPLTFHVVASVSRRYLPVIMK